MNDNRNKSKLGIIGAVAVGIAAVAAAVTAVNKSKKKKNFFFKDELIKLPVFRKDEPVKKTVVKEEVEEEDIFEDEDNVIVEEKSFFGDDEISYEVDDEFKAESHATPITAPFEKKSSIAKNTVIEPFTEPFMEQVSEETFVEAVEEETATEESMVEEVVETVEEPVVEEAAETVEEPVAEAIEEPVVEEKTEPVVRPLFESFSEPVIEFFDDSEEMPTEEETKVTETISDAVSEPVVELVQEISEPVADSIKEIEPIIEELKVEESDLINNSGTIEFESVVVGRTETAEEAVTEPVIEEVTEEVTEPVIEEVTVEVTEPVIEEVTEEVTEPVVEEVIEEATELEAEAVEDAVPEDDNTIATEDSLAPNERVYDWIYNVDEHYDVISDGTWVYCRANAVLESTSVNKKGGHEIIDIADTFKNRIDPNGYCLLKYIGTEKNVEIPAVINGRPVVATMNTFRSNQNIKKVTIPATVQGLRRTFYSCYHLDKIYIEEGSKIEYELDAIMCGNNDMDSNTESTTVYCSAENAAYFRGHYRLGCPVIFVES